MKNKIKFYLLWTLVISNLFYLESFGLNALIISIISIILYGITEEHKIKFKKWWLASSLWLISGLSVFLTGSHFSIAMYMITFLYFVAVHHNFKLSIPFGLAQSLQSFFTGFFFFFESIRKYFSRPKEEKNNKWIINLLLVLIPLIIAITFLKLYQTADSTFYKYTKFINLDWISWGFISFFALLTISLYGFYYYSGEKSIDEFEDSLKNKIPLSYTDKIQKFLGSNNEMKGAVGLLVTLNLLLLLYNIIDLNFLTDDLQNPGESIRYSDVIHQGINALITSIILVIIVITFLFRGNLNFAKNKTAKILAYFWLSQNLIMVCTTVIKNYEYISHWGLTYKRLGVYIYLLLAAIGLVITIYKILHIKSIWFLLRNTSVAFIIVFTLIPVINWNSVIAKYNLNELAYKQIDFKYLLNLGEDTYPHLLLYQEEHNNLPINLHKKLDRRTTRYLFEFEEKSHKNTWRSIVLGDYKLYQNLSRINIVYASELTENIRK